MAPGARGPEPSRAALDAVCTPGTASITESAPASPGRRGVSRAPATRTTGASGRRDRRDQTPRVSASSAAGDGSARSKTSPAITTRSGPSSTTPSTARAKATATSFSRTLRPRSARSYARKPRWSSERCATIKGALAPLPTGPERARRCRRSVGVARPPGPAPVRASARPPRPRPARPRTSSPGWRSPSGRPP